MKKNLALPRRTFMKAAAGAMARVVWKLLEGSWKGPVTRKSTMSATRDDRRKDEMSSSTPRRCLSVPETAPIAPGMLTSHYAPQATVRLGASRVAPGEARYGRWGDTTLRLVPRRVEQSTDNNRFRTLAQQDRNCQFPEL